MAIPTDTPLAPENALAHLRLQLNAALHPARLSWRRDNLASAHGSPYEFSLNPGNGDTTSLNIRTGYLTTERAKQLYDTLSTNQIPAEVVKKGDQHFVMIDCADFTRTQHTIDSITGLVAGAKPALAAFAESVGSAAPAQPSAPAKPAAGQAAAAAPAPAP